MKFNRDYAEKLAEQALAEFRGLHYGDVFQRLGEQSTAEHADRNGNTYIVCTGISKVNETSDDVEVEVYVSLKGGRNLLPDIAFRSLCFSPSHTR